MPPVFSQGQREKTDEALIAALYQEIGQLKVELDWLKKLVGTLTEQRTLIDPSHPDLSVVRQCSLLGLARSSYYYWVVPESEENLHLMHLLDEQTRTPFYGIAQMTAWLCSQGYAVNHKRVAVNRGIS